MYKAIHMQNISVYILMSQNKIFYITFFYILDCVVYKASTLTCKLTGAQCDLLVNKIPYRLTKFTY